MKQLLASLFLGTAIGLCAQPIPKLNSISKQYIQRGTSTEVTLNGDNIGSGKILISGEPGIKITLPTPAAANIGIESSLGGVATVPQTDSKKLVATIEIAENAAVGPREFRVASPGGVSNPMVVTV